MSGIKFALLLSCLTIAACVKNPAPKGVLPEAEFVGNSPFGAWANVTMLSGGIQSGELLAVSEDSIWLLQNGTKGIAKGDAIRLQVALFDAKTRGRGVWLAIGSLLTISNGAFLLFTAPMWWIGGGATNAVASKQPLYIWRTGVPLEPFAKFARFPGGLPPEWK